MYKIVSSKCKQLSKRSPNSSGQQTSKDGDSKSSMKRQQTLELYIKLLTEKAGPERSGYCITI